MNVLDSIRSHAFLEKGWYLGKGEPLSQDVINAGIRLCELIVAKGYSVDDIEDFPYSDGQLEVVLLGITAYGSDHEYDLSFTIASTGIVARVKEFVDIYDNLLATNISVEEAPEYIPLCQKKP